MIDVDSELRLTTKHLELEGLQCDNVIGGHCVECDALCNDCYLENTNGMVYGFYAGIEPMAGTCSSCKANSEVDPLTGECKCTDAFFFDEAS